MASEKKKHKEGVQFEILRNPGIHLYSGFREKKHKGGGVKFEILKNPGIDFYSGFRKTSQGGGGENLIPKKVGPPLTSNPGSATDYVV